MLFLTFLELWRKKKEFHFDLCLDEHNNIFISLIAFFKM